MEGVNLSFWLWSAEFITTMGKRQAQGLKHQAENSQLPAQAGSRESALDNTVSHYILKADPRDAPPPIRPT